MKNINSLKNSREFGRVYSNGKSYANKYLVMIVLGNDLDCNRIGFSISKKVGNSVVRHYFARILREIYRLHKEVFSSGLDIVVIARASAKGKDFHHIESAYLHLGKMHGILKEKVVK